MADFEIKHDEDLAQKLNKRDLAIRYLGFINNSDEILNRNQSKQALDYLLDLLLQNENNSQTENTITIFTMTDANQSLIINTLFDLIKTELKTYLTDTKNFNFSDSEQMTRINCTQTLLSKLIATVELLSRNSNQFCVKFHENLKLKDLYEIIQIIQLEYTESEIKTAKNQIKNLVLLILHLSRFACMYKNQWDDACISLLISFQIKFSQYFDSINWYVFLVNENLSVEIVNVEQAYKYNYSFEINDNESKQDQIKKCILGYKYLKFLNDPKKITSSEQSMNILYYIYECEYFYYDENESTFKFELIQTFVNLLIYFYDIITENIKSNMENESKKIDIKIKKNLIMIEKLTVIIQSYSNVSFKFCFDFNKTPNAIEYLFKFIQSDLLSDYLVENLTKKVSSFILKQLFDGILGCLHNLSQVYLNFQKLWEQCDSVNSLIKFSDKLGAINERYRWYVYMIVANIATDTQIDSLSEIKVALINIINFVKNCALAIESGEPERIKVQLEENENMEEITISNADEELTFHLAELFKALYHLAGILNHLLQYPYFLIPIFCSTPILCTFI